MEDEGPTCRLDGCDKPANTSGQGIGFCSKAHYHTDWRIRTGRQPGLKPRICPYPKCGVEFQPARANAIYCCRKHKDLDAYRRNPDTYKKSQKKRFDANPELLAQSRERAAAWVEANPEAARAHYRRAILRKRGVTPDGYEALAAQFNGACWLCREAMDETTPTGRKRSYHVDHDHAHALGDPAGVRGLLDTWCNTRLAVVEDVNLVAAIDTYLKERAAYQPPPATGTERSPRLWSRFRLTVDQHDAMVRACGNRCEICRQSEKPTKDGRARPLSVDHDHAKSLGDLGFVRGLLCNSCNSAVGVRENHDWWAAASDYLTWALPLAQQLIASHPLPERDKR